MRPSSACSPSTRPELPNHAAGEPRQGQRRVPRDRDRDHAQGFRDAGLGARSAQGAVAPDSRLLARGLVSRRARRKKRNSRNVCHQPTSHPRPVAKLRRNAGCVPPLTFRRAAKAPEETHDAQLDDVRPVRRVRHAAHRERRSRSVVRRGRSPCVVPFVPGGSASTARAQRRRQMSETLGQQIVIENRGGAGGRSAPAPSQSSAPDGYTPRSVTSATLGDRAEPAAKPRLRSARRPRPDRHHRRDAEPDRGASVLSRPLARRVDQDRQGDRDPDPVRVARRRHAQPPHGRAARLSDRHEARPRSLQGREPGDQRSARRPYRRADRRAPERA